MESSWLSCMLSVLQVHAAANRLPGAYFAAYLTVYTCCGSNPQPLHAIFLVCAQVRSLVVPAATAALVAVLHAARLLPADPVCRLVLLLQVACAVIYD